MSCVPLNFLWVPNPQQLSLNARMGFPIDKLSSKRYSPSDIFCSEGIMSKSFGERLRELRELAGLTQQQLATRAGLSLSNLAQTEQGLKGDPKAKTAIALAEALNMSVYDLIGEITVGG